MAEWQFSDINKSINKLCGKAYEYSRSGLKTVACLGGIGGMKSFVRRKGQYDPSDELGTSLQDNYYKFVNAG